MLRRFGTSLIAAVLMASLAGAAQSNAPVADAAMRGDLAAVRTLLQEGADVNASHGDGMSALHWAAERGNAALIEMLVYAGANPHAETRIGQYTPLHLAGRAGQAPAVAALIKAGAKVDATTTTSGVTPLHLAAAAGSAESVRLLAEKGADVNAPESNWGQTPLIFAAAQNRTEAIKALLALGAKPDVTTSTVDLGKHTVIDRAANQLQRQIYDGFRKQQGASRDLSPAQVQAGVQAARALYASGSLPPAADAAGGSDNQDAQIQQFIMQGASSVGAKGGLTALLHAARQGYVDAAMALIDGGADVNLVSAGDGTSPLLMAVINGQFDLAIQLLERGADPNIKAEVNGVAPLWAAVNAQWQPRTRFPQPQQMELQSANYLDVMEALLKKGADPDARIGMHPWYMVYSGCGNANCGLADTGGSTAFWRAAYAVDLPAMKLLAKYGADPNIPTMAPAQRRRGGGGPPPAAAPAPAPPAAPVRANTAASNQRAVDGAVTPPSGTGRPALRPMAAAPNPTEAVDPNEDQSGLPPIPAGGPGVFPLHAGSGVGYGEGFAGNAHRHAPDGWMAAVKYMLEELGGDVNARDHNGYTPLHHAAARGDNEMILYLVSKGADVTAVSRRGQSVADMANGPVQRVSPYPATVALLEKLGSKNNHNCVSC
ncbi:MAG: ankyrin repeat domain-containing protein [Vicinamibacterales bacterium]|nr:ankyrin repeat domain-containing protein [Vicinamibacterales bacterium]